MTGRDDGSRASARGCSAWPHQNAVVMGSSQEGRPSGECGEHRALAAAVKRVKGIYSWCGLQATLITSLSPSAHRQKATSSGSLARHGNSASRCSSRLLCGRWVRASKGSRLCPTLAFLCARRRRPLHGTYLRGRSFFVHRCVHCSCLGCTRARKSRFLCL
jgi:hypothetical protein